MGTLALSATALTLAVTAGAAATTFGSYAITVTNDGPGAWAGPQAAITYGSGAGWLALATTRNADGSLTYTPTVDPAALTAATYTATITVTDTNVSNSGQTASVSCVVAAATTPPASGGAIIQPDHSSMDFRCLEGATATTPASEGMAIANIGTDAFAGLVATPSVAYVEATMNGSTLTVRPNGAGLAALTAGQNYLSTVTLSDANAGQDASVSILVTVGAQAASPFLNVTPGAMTIAGVAGDGTTHSMGAVITDGNGTGQLTQPSAGAVTYGPGATGWLAASVTGNASPYTLTCVATTGALVAGTYTASFVLSGGGATNTVTMPVTFVVSAAASAAYDTPRFTLPDFVTYAPADDTISGEPMAAPALGGFA